MTLRLNGSTSGYVEIDAPAVAGTSALTLPTGTGTIAKETGAWTSWTPTWTADSGTPSYGNGNLYAKYVQIGKTVHFSFRLIWGSTTTATGSGWLFSFPPITPSVDFNAIHGMVHNGNTGTTWRGSGFNFLNNIYFYVTDNSGTRIGGGTPGTWAAGWYLAFSGTYEAA